MPRFAIFIIGLEVLLFIAALVAIVVLIVRKQEVKKKENFEKRDN